MPACLPERCFWLDFGLTCPPCADDPSGRWQQLQGLIAGNPRAARLAAVGSLGAELLALAVACWLHAIYTAAYEAWLDDSEEQSERVREALARTVVQTYAGERQRCSARVEQAAGRGCALDWATRGWCLHRPMLTPTHLPAASPWAAGGSKSSWSARLRSKYGVEASALEATTNAARQAAALQSMDP